MEKFNEEARSQESEYRIPSPLPIRETTNHTNYVKEIYIINSFVIFVLFVVKKMAVGVNKKLYVFCSFFFL
jgi:hypothetical protein